MKDLYSSTAGNPDLREERSTNWKWASPMNDRLVLTGAVFYNRIRDLIQSIRTPEGWRMPTNVGRARITGFELGARKELESLKLSVNYTYIDSEDLGRGSALAPGTGVTDQFQPRLPTPTRLAGEPLGNGSPRTSRRCTRTTFSRCPTTSY